MMTAVTPIVAMVTGVAAAFVTMTMIVMSTTIGRFLCFFYAVKLCS